VLGVGAAGADAGLVLVTGIAGLLAGALSMGAGEYVSVSSQRELLAASTPSPQSAHALTRIDFDENEVALVFRARGMSEEEAEHAAHAVLRGPVAPVLPANEVDVETVGTPLGVALSSFGFFASGALVPILPYLLGASGLLAVVLAAVLVGIALLASGAVVGLLSGAPMLARALRQLLIGYGAAAVTYVLGLLFNAAGI
jgi:VIT1/CCC1 family predicted Fe2+/Mn2+ transporter